MKITEVVGLLAMTGMDLSARQAPKPVDLTVIAYVNNTVANSMTLQKAKVIATGMFARSGVHIEWRGHEPDNCCLPAGAIVVSLNSGTPGSYMPGAFGFARPYEGVHITVFYDRLERGVNSDWTSTLLAHVMVHEMTHVLQGVNRHSETGVMKANWSGGDYSEMTLRPLPFTAYDIKLIRDGARARAQRRTTNGANLAADDATR